MDIVRPNGTGFWCACITNPLGTTDNYGGGVARTLNILASYG